VLYPRTVSLQTAGRMIVALAAVAVAAGILLPPRDSGFSAGSDG
jgi:hypothetical protein